MTEIIGVPYSLDDASSDDFLRAEQKEYPTLTRVMLNDIQEMFLLALTGKSAKSYLNTECPVHLTDNNIGIVSLEFYVFTSFDAMNYSFEPNMGSVITVGPHLLRKEYNVVIDFTKEYELDYRVADYTCNWESHIITTDGRMLRDAKFKIVGNKILLDDKLFGVLRFNGHAICTKHILSIPIAMTPETKIASFKPAITINWEKSNGDGESTVIEFTVPECVYTAFTLCSSGKPRTGMIRRDEKYIPVVYYSACDGTVKGTYYDKVYT